MSTDIHICFMNATHFWGGGEKWHYDAARFFSAKNDFKVSAICSKGSSLSQKLKACDITVYERSFGKISFLFPWKRQSMVGLLQEIAPDIIVMNGSLDLKHAAIASHEAGIPIRIYRRGFGDPIRNNQRNTRYFYREITHILTNSKFTASQFNSFDEPGIHKKLSTIYNGIVTEDFQPSHRHSDKIHIGTTSRLAKYKRIDHVLGALKMLENKDVVFHIAGIGEELSALRQMCSKLNLKSKVNFHGFVKDIPEFLQHLNIFIHAAEREAFGFSVIEAMATSLPVVAYRSGAMPEIVLDGQTGFLCEDNNIPCLARKLDTLIKSYELRQQMGREGRKRVEEEFNKVKQFGKLESLLREWYEQEQALED